MCVNYDWSEFLRLAESLESSPDCPGPPEAALRSATSRAYYAALQLACSFARSEGFELSGQDSIHRDVPRHFRDTGTADPTRLLIATNLKRLHKQRIKADYRDVFSGTCRALASMAVNRAKGIEQKLISLRQRS